MTDHDDNLDYWTQRDVHFGQCRLGTLDDPVPCLKQDIGHLDVPGNTFGEDQVDVL
jgi:hypothetical protein